MKAAMRAPFAVIGVLAALGASAAALAEDQPATAILSPADGTNIPRDGIDPCLKDNRYCSLAEVVGRVEEGYWPFLAVRPEASSPRFWIQSRIDRIERDRTFRAIASLGANENGARMFFDIFIIAHRDPKRFGAFDIQSGLPPECEPAKTASAHPLCVISAPTTIFRTR